VLIDIPELNQSITSFFESNGTVYTRNQWLATYRASAQAVLEEDAPPEQSTSAEIARQSSSSTDEYWTWSNEYGRYYHKLDDGSCEWYDGEASSSSSTQKTGGRGHGKGKGKRR